MQTKNSSHYYFSQDQKECAKLLAFPFPHTCLNKIIQNETWNQLKIAIT